MQAQMDIEDLVQRCRSANARAYIKEAVDCYRIGAYRACVITTWIALVYDFIDKLRELAMSNDPTAAKKVTEFDDIQKIRNTEAALKFERDVLRMAKEDFELITVQEQVELGRIFEDRNRCSHPNLNRDNEIYTPTAELARLHLRVAIEHVLERAPVQGKAALSMLNQYVDSDYFPIEVGDAEKFLRATPLPRAKKILVQNFVLGALISMMKEPLSEKKKFQRLVATQVAQRLHPDYVKSVLQEKFDDAVFKTSDNCIARVLWLIYKCPDLQPLLKEATWVKLKNYVRMLPSQEIDANLFALSIPQLRQFGLERIKISTKAELQGMVARLREKPDDAFIERCISLYCEASSFDSANVMAKELINPLLIHVNPEQAASVIKAGENNQVKDSTQYPGVVFRIKKAELLSKQAFVDIIKKAKLEDTLGYLVVDASASEG